MTTMPMNMQKMAIEALETAYVPYSHFPVGASLQAASGKLYKGINIENVSFGLTNCAERTAIFSAIAAGERAFTGLVIAGKTQEPIAPCGACRQVMVEFFDAHMPVWLINDQGQTIETTVGDLMPGAFQSLT
jgi:cytidine deaminase